MEGEKEMGNRGDGKQRGGRGVGGRAHAKAEGETEQEGGASCEGDNQTHLSTPPRSEQRSALRMEGSMS